MERLNFTHPIHLIVGLTLWSVWFVAVYSGLSVACAVNPPPPEARSLTLLSTPRPTAQAQQHREG